MNKLVSVLLVTLLAGVLAEDAPPVKMDLYYETMCPYSQDYFYSQLYPTFEELGYIMDVNLYPYGNANYVENDDGGYDFTCQHGPDECTGNMIHACAQKYIDDISVEMDFVYCLLAQNSPATDGPACAAQVGVDYTPIDQCVNSVEGEEALHAVAVQQDSLVPSVAYVPWILVDDVYNENLNTACRINLKRVVCNHYTGPTPPECEKLEELDQDIDVPKCFKN
uniref:Gamma-interferon-inducible lysosomal thiol reductase-like n=1 Tax=Hirondellea gigas TaxID=1518452 RepID=A0A2P2I849_9CRUS